MRMHSRWARIGGLVACAAVAGCRSHTPEAATGAASRPVPGAKGAQVRTAFTRALPSMDGNSVAVTLVEVGYGPGGSSAPHRHPCAVVGYVVEGALRSQVQGEPEAVYHAGESFYEAPNAVHLVSANASGTEPVRFLAWFTCDHEGPLSVPVSDAAHVR
jgi:quercetin dioxygenase-like cupin family protein